LPAHSKDIDENQKLIQRSIVKIWHFVCYHVEKKHNEDLFSVLFPQQLDDRGSIGVAKIETTEMPF